MSASSVRDLPARYDDNAGARRSDRRSPPRSPRSGPVRGQDVSRTQDRRDQRAPAPRDASPGSRRGRSRERDRDTSLTTHQRRPSGPAPSSDSWAGGRDRSPFRGRASSRDRDIASGDRRSNRDERDVAWPDRRGAAGSPPRGDRNATSSRTASSSHALSSRDTGSSGSSSRPTSGRPDDYSRDLMARYGAYAAYGYGMYPPDFDRGSSSTAYGSGGASSGDRDRRRDAGRDSRDARDRGTFAPMYTDPRYAAYYAAMMARDAMSPRDRASYEAAAAAYYASVMGGRDPRDVGMRDRDTARDRPADDRDRARDHDRDRDTNRDRPARFRDNHSNGSGGGGGGRGPPIPGRIGGTRINDYPSGGAAGENKLLAAALGITADAPVVEFKTDIAPRSEGPRTDYSQHFVDTGERPQNYIRDGNPATRYFEYPKLDELCRLKNEMISQRSTPPMYMKSDLKTMDLTQLGTKFDVILIDPPWPEYRRRCPGALIDSEVWSEQDLMNLRIDLVAASPSFLFLWCGSEEGLEIARRLLKHWGFRRCEDIAWLKTNHNSVNDSSLKYDQTTVLQHTSEHCLMGIKGTVRRSTDGHFIHANVDTDIIIGEQPPYGSTRKPEEMYELIERFCLGRRRLELFGEDHNIRPGWVTLGKSLTASNYDKALYLKHFEGPNGTLLGTSERIEQLRPKSPPRKDKGGPGGRGGRGGRGGGPGNRGGPRRGGGGRGGH